MKLKTTSNIKKIILSILFITNILSLLFYLLIVTLIESEEGKKTNNIFVGEQKKITNYIENTNDE